MKSRLMKRILLVPLLASCTGALADTPPTVRVDYYHTGNAENETYSLHQVVIQPLPWPGHP